MVLQLPHTNLEDKILVGLDLGDRNQGDKSVEDSLAEDNHVVADTDDLVDKDSLEQGKLDLLGNTEEAGFAFFRVVF